MTYYIKKINKKKNLKLVFLKISKRTDTYVFLLLFVNATAGFDLSLRIHKVTGGE